MNKAHRQATRSLLSVKHVKGEQRECVLDEEERPPPPTPILKKEERQKTSAVKHMSSTRPSTR